MSDIAIQCSPFFAQLLQRHPDWFADLRSSGRLENTSPPEAETLQSLIATAGLDAGLRQFRNFEIMRIIWRDLNQKCELEETLTDLSQMADVCLQAATTTHSREMRETHGAPRNEQGVEQGLVVLALGKLGGFELNLSSDVDIIFCFPNNGQCDGRRGLSNEQFFTRLARKIIQSLSQVTADGFCFRVDTRLRPFGDSGPLVSSFAALEQYYQREGRDWERYALIKARPVAGDMDAAQTLLGILKPFVYRRYIDFGAIDALHDMHGNVRADALRSDREDDVKRGSGGIREIEFLIQSFQLLRGGRETSLQTTSFFEAAKQLQNLEILPPDVVQQILDAYRFLRNVENRIQALHDQQTHRVPGGEDGLRVATAMGFADFDSFQSALKKVRSGVELIFERSLPESRDSQVENPYWINRWQHARNINQGSAAAEVDWKPLADFSKRVNRLSLSQRASRRLDEFMPLLLERLDALSFTDEIAGRVFDLISAICQRSAYLALLVQNPGATERMLELFASSKRVAATVTRYPALLDELIDPSLGAHPTSRLDIQADVQRILKGRNDTETALQHLNYCKQATDLRISVAVLRATMSASEVQHSLGELAESLLQAVLSLALDEVKQRHGELPGPQLAVIAYGSFGATALGFDSDLDLIFLYQSGEDRSDGKRPLQTERYHTSVARRLLSLLSALTPAGRLYTIDARLRPNGQSGLLVSSNEAFRRYQLERAWTWELQALTRARPVAGSEQVAAVFTRTRAAALIAEKDPAAIARDVIGMRERLFGEHLQGDPLKHAAGGMLDIEFIAQLGILLNAQQHPDVIKSTELSPQLAALQKCGWIDNEQRQTLDYAYTQLTHARQKKTLIDENSDIDNQHLLAIAEPLCEEFLQRSTWLASSPAGGH